MNNSDIKTIADVPFTECESNNIGRISIDELNANPDLIREKIDIKIKEILDKYGYRFVITGFAWDAGNVTGSIDLVKSNED